MSKYAPVTAGLTSSTSTIGAAGERLVDVAAKATTAAAKGAQVSTQWLFDPTRPLVNRLLGLAFYTSLFAGVVFVILLFVHFTIRPVFAFSVDSQGIVPVSTSDSSQTQFSRVPSTPDTAMEFRDLLPFFYTISFDAFLSGDFTTSSVPRVLLYRALGPVTMTSADTETGLTNRFPNSNIIVYVDPLKNDLYVSALLEDGSRIRSEPIQNVPLRRAFRVTLTVTCQYLEVYMNGDLKVTVSLPRRLADDQSVSKFYGPPGLVNGNFKIANVTYWSTVLSSKSIRLQANAPISTGIFT